MSDMLITKEQVVDIKSKLRIALKKFSEENNVILEMGTGSFYPEAGNFAFKITGVVEGGMTNEAYLYQVISEYPHNADWPKLGSEFVVKGEKCIVTGLRQARNGDKIQYKKEGSDSIFETEAQALIRWLNKQKEVK